MKAVILCAGMGSRLGTLTKDTPKSLLQIADRPILFYIINQLKICGIYDVAINIFHHGEKILRYCGNNHNFDLSLNFFEENTLKGTAGSLIQMEKWLKDDAVLVIYGDIFFQGNLRSLIERYNQKNPFAALFVHKNANSNSKIFMDDDNRIVAFYERPSPDERAGLGVVGYEAWANSGIQVLSPRAILKIMQHQLFDLPRDLFVPNVEREFIIGHPFQGIRVAVDSVEALMKANMMIEKREL